MKPVPDMTMQQHRALEEFSCGFDQKNDDVALRWSGLQKLNIELTDKLNKLRDNLHPKTIRGILCAFGVLAAGLATIPFLPAAATTVALFAFASTGIACVGYGVHHMLKSEGVYVRKADRVFESKINDLTCQIRQEQHNILTQNAAELTQSPYFESVLRDDSELQKSFAIVSKKEILPVAQSKKVAVRLGSLKP